MIDRLNLVIKQNSKAEHTPELQVSCLKPLFFFFLFYFLSPTFTQSEALTHTHIHTDKTRTRPDTHTNSRAGHVPRAEQG